MNFHAFFVNDQLAQERFGYGFVKLVCLRGVPGQPDFFLEDVSNIFWSGRIFFWIQVHVEMDFQSVRPKPGQIGMSGAGILQ